MSRPEKHLYEFGVFRLDPTERRLLRDGEPVQLEPKVFDTLVLLIENGGHLLGKDELMSQLWPDAFVEEGSLTKNISTLRRILGEGENGQRYIETVSKRGYRFVVSVREVPDSSCVLVVEEHTRVRMDTEEEDASALGGTGQSEVSSRSDRLSDGHSGIAARATTPLSLHTRRLAAEIKNRKVWMIAVLAVSVGAIGVTYLHYSRASRAAIDSIAVLPFTYSGPDTDPEYLTEGVTESIIFNLSQLHDLKVMPRGSVFRYMGREADAQTVGRELGVRAVLTGRIIQRGDNLSIAVELVDASDNRSLWGERYERKVNELLGAQQTISREISDRLRPKLTNEQQQRLTRNYTNNAEAYQLYLKGRYFWNKRTSEGTREGLNFFQQAIDADPQYALAYAGLADSHIVIATFFSSTNPAEEWLKAKEAALKALELDNGLSEAHVAGFCQILV